MKVSSKMAEATVSETARILALPTGLTAPVPAQRMPAGRPRRNVVVLASHVARKRVCAALHAPAVAAKTPYELACAEVAQAQKSLQTVSQLWHRVNSDLALATARMHHLRQTERVLFSAGSAVPRHTRPSGR